LKPNIIDFAQFHFVLMWTKNPSRVLQETTRVSRQKGITMAIESDYSGRVENLPSYQTSTSKPSMALVMKLKHAGADPFIGHQLPHLFRQATYSKIKFGVLSWEYNQSMATQGIRNDYRYLDHKPPPDMEYGFTFTPVFWIVGSS
ncbi:MAG: hypothetical protein ACW976_04240, partial [Candidatus Ranarchaeia archaeon]